MIHKLAILFDEELLRESWRLATVKRVEKYDNDIIALLSEVKKRAEVAPLDARSKELIIDALDFGISKPLSLDFGHPDKNIISPNAVGFQFVVAAIARRTRKKRRKSVSSIVVDRQNQFNTAQIGTHYNLSRIAEGIKNSSEQDKVTYFSNPLYTGFSPEEVSHKGLTDRDLTISKSADSIGLQIVDVYLWIANKLFSGVNLPSEIIELWNLFQHRSLIDGISMRGMAERFKNFEKNLPNLSDLTVEQRLMVKESVDQHRKKVKALV